MATGTYCDRCTRARRDLVTVAHPAGKIDLCARCMACLLAWVQSGRQRHETVVAAPTKIRRAQWMTYAREISDRDGHITPDALASVAGIARERAHWQLNYLARQKLINRIEPGRYALGEPPSERSAPRVGWAGKAAV